MKSFNELRNEINEVEKKKPCTDCEKKATAKTAAAKKKKTKELNDFLKDEGEDTQKAGPQGVNH
jgi:hypothetical protein